MTAVLLIGFVVLLCLGFPVAFALGISGFVMMMWIQGTSALPALPTIIFESLNSFTLIAIPLFILMGNILVGARISRDIYQVIRDWFGTWPGGVAVSTVFFSAGFSAISGSSVATASTIGSVALPEMLNSGYERRFSLGIVAAGGTIGILIPPSLFMILYGSLTDVSVGKLFIAGILPGLLMSGLFLAYVVAIAWLNGNRGEQKLPWAQRLASLRRGFWGMLLPPIILGGIYAGIFTPTEAAAMGVVYSLLVAFVVKKMTLADLHPILLNTTKTTVMVFFIIMGAKIFGHTVTMLQLPQQLIIGLGELGVSPHMFILLIGILFIFMGDFLEVVSITLITLPIIYPILVAMGIDPLWFAVIMCIFMEFALITPPVGLNLFVIQGLLPGSTTGEIFRGTLPFMGLMALTLILVVAFPSLSTWLPQLMR
ncbi:MAG: TRAP transporter large permease subunit [Rhodospirillaceae bacterium]|jgi:C4-dicarboxylate transporter, DctM subunit|nr:TRAP transporter large permease subunit [Rhodospirillaceae bacterium]